MNYNKFIILGNRLNLRTLTRRLHDSKLPSVTEFPCQSNYKKLIGVDSPRKADAVSYPKLKNTESKIDTVKRTANETSAVWTKR